MQENTMSNLIETASFKQETLEQIWGLVGVVEPLSGFAPVACSFQGGGTRTRTTMLQALGQIDLNYIELPAFLDTGERPQDLAGYLDPFYSLYIVRYSDHDKLKAFAEASQRPVINAMSSLEHPCEAIADAFWFHHQVKALKGARIVIWGTGTNVLRSWSNIARIAGSNLYPVDNEEEALPENIDLVITDGWPRKSPGPMLSLTLEHLEQMGFPVLLPTPPFTIGEELAFDPVTYSRFSGYDQKACLLPVQKAIIRFVMVEHTNP
jgi:ornithine carbamoyltransferase